MAGESLPVLHKEFFTLFFSDIWEAAFGEVWSSWLFGVLQKPKLGGGVKIAFQEWEVNERSSPQATETENHQILHSPGFFFRLTKTPFCLFLKTDESTTFMFCCPCTLVKTNAKFYYISTKFYLVTLAFTLLR